MSFPIPVPKLDQSTLIVSGFEHFGNTLKSDLMQGPGRTSVSQGRGTEAEGISFQGRWEELPQGISFPGYQLTPWFTQTPEDGF